MTISLTERAAEEVKKIANENEFDEDWYLRVGVKSGGCSGLQYEFDLFASGENEYENDRVLTSQGVTLRIHPKAYLYLNDLTISYSSDGLNSGFSFDNPSAKRSCGCGTSFTT